MATWVQSQASGFLADVGAVLDPTAIQTELSQHTSRFSDEFLGNIASVLIWHSGKDLLAALQPWLQATYRLHPSQLRLRIRDWMVANVDQTLRLLPEWNGFLEMLRSFA